MTVSGALSHVQALAGTALVSAAADQSLRDAVADGGRPIPDYLLLEHRHGVRLHDWSRTPVPPRRRSTAATARQLASALPALRNCEVVLSDGEHLGLPLAAAGRLLLRRRAHVVIGHNLSVPNRIRQLRAVSAYIDRVVVHSEHNRQHLVRAGGLQPHRVVHIPYGVDTDFWQDLWHSSDDALVVSAGREHRDYRTLAAACERLPVRVFVADGSAHSPDARRDAPGLWPDNFTRGFLGLPDLRTSYAAATAIVVPLVPNDFSAGVTTLMEAMAMGRAVVATATPAMAELVDHGRTGLLVPPGDVDALAAAIRALLDRPDERARLGNAAREAMLARGTLTGFVDGIAQVLADATAEVRLGRAR